jgi:ABC-2 type transport system ATP-binding protein
VSANVGLIENLDQRFRTFSKGMLQKAMLASALLGNPAVMILDEPMSGLDPESRERMKERFRAWKGQGKTLIFSSHAFEDVYELADRVLELKAGKIQYLGKPENWRPGV